VEGAGRVDARATMLRRMTLTRLDPTYPLVWRSPTAIQFGSRAPVLVLDDVTSAEERMLAVLTKGVPRAALAIQAQCREREAEALLERLAPVLGRPSSSPTGPGITVRARGDACRRLAELARDLGLLGPGRPGGPTRGARASEPAPGGAGLLLCAYAVPPASVRDWTVRGVPHLAVIFDETAATVTPVVVPGRTPCLRCLELRQRDADPCWPAVASQLVDRAAPAAEDPALGLLALAAGIRRLRAGILRPERAETTMLRLDLGGTDQRIEVAQHGECGCDVDLQLPVAA